MKTKETVRSGYRLERVYVAQQEYRVLDVDELSDTVGAEREVSFGWDWRALGPRRFEVLIEVSVDPSRESPELANVRLFGVFSAGKPKLSIAFKDFVGTNAPAILFPYAREIISTMTGRGPFGAFHIEPLNIRAITGAVRLDETSGHEYLRAHPEEAANFELYDVDEESSETVPPTAGG